MYSDAYWKADGTKCKPFVIFKRKRPVARLQEKFPGLVISYSDNGWMNESLTLQYLERVIGPLCFGKRLLVWDAYRCHLVATVKDRLTQYKVDAAVIPGGCTKFLQPADVSWNKSLKNKLSDAYDEWMEKGEHEYTAGGNMRAPSLELVCTWIRDSWGLITRDMVAKSFVSCGISAPITGEQDDQIVCLRSDDMATHRESLVKKTTDLASLEPRGDVTDDPDPEEGQDNEGVIDLDADSDGDGSGDD